MSKLSEADVAKLLAVEMCFFPSVRLSRLMVKAWFLHFHTCTSEEFATALHIAVNQAIKGFPPMPGEVWAVVRRLRATPETLESADQAWASVMGSGRISARAEAAAALVSGWTSRQLWTVDQTVWKKKEFERIYDDLKEQDEILETQNIARRDLGYGRTALTDGVRSVMEALQWK
jgi:hypothetical protein